MNSEFISNGRNEYSDINAVMMSEEELSGISRIIKFSINEKTFISGNELLEAINQKYPSIVVSN